MRPIGFWSTTHQALDVLHAAADLAAERLRRWLRSSAIAFVLLGRHFVPELRRATSSTSTWLTRLDLPEPDTPVTLVNTPSGNVDVELVQVVARDARQRAASRSGVRGARCGTSCPPNRWRRVCDASTCASPAGGPL